MCNVIVCCLPLHQIYSTYIMPKRQRMESEGQTLTFNPSDDSRWQHLYNNEFLSDFTLKLCGEGREDVMLSAHKTVLVAASKWFAVLFGKSFKEVEGEWQPERGSADCWMMVLRHIYGHNVNVPVLLLPELLLICDEYQFDTISPKFSASVHDSLSHILKSDAALRPQLFASLQRLWASPDCLKPVWHELFKQMPRTELWGELQYAFIIH